MASHWRGHDWDPAKFYFLGDSAQKELQRFQATIHQQKALSIQLINGTQHFKQFICENYL
jgi:hypothetical protein